MYHQTGRFVQDDKLFILINNIEWNILGLYFIFVTRPVEEKSNDICRFHPIVAFHWLAVHMNETCPRRRLQTVARCIRQVIKQKLIDTQQLLPTISHYPEMLIKFRIFIFFQPYGTKVLLCA